MYKVYFFIQVKHIKRGKMYEDTDQRTKKGDGRPITLVRNNYGFYLFNRSGSSVVRYCS